MSKIEEVRERLAAISCVAGARVSAESDDIAALLDDHARLQALEDALGGWSLAANEDGTVCVICLRADSPGGDIAIANNGRLAQRLLHALVTDIVAARKKVQP